MGEKVREVGGYDRERGERGEGREEGEEATCEAQVTKNWSDETRQKKLILKNIFCSRNCHQEQK